MVSCYYNGHCGHRTFKSPQKALLDNAYIQNYKKKFVADRQAWYLSLLVEITNKAEFWYQCQAVLPHRIFSSMAIEVSSSLARGITDMCE